MYKLQPEHPRTQAASAIEEWQRRSEKKSGRKTRNNLCQESRYQLSADINFTQFTLSLSDVLFSCMDEKVRENLFHLFTAAESDSLQELDLVLERFG